jgi:hypothetical protein
MPPYINKNYYGTGTNTKDLQRAAMSTMKVCFSPKIPYMVHSLLNNRSGNL